jgi:hypothetical protein
VNNFYVEPAYVNAAAKDFRIVPGTPCASLVIDPGSGPKAGNPSKRAARQVVLQSSRRWVRVGGRLTLSGRRTATSSAKRVRLQVRRGKRWVRVRTARLRPGGDFKAKLRLRRRTARLAFGSARLPRRAPSLRLRAHIPGLGYSASVRVRIRR